MQVGKGSLHWAAQFGETAVLQWLLVRAVDANAKDGAGNSPLHLAALNGHTCAPPSPARTCCSSVHTHVHRVKQLSTLGAPRPNESSISRAVRCLAAV